MIDDEIKNDKREVMKEESLEETKQWAERKKHTRKEKEIRRGEKEERKWKKGRNQGKG